MPLSSPSKEQMTADVRAWNQWAEAMNAKALARGIVTSKELEQQQLREARRG